MQNHRSVSHLPRDLPQIEDFWGLIFFNFFSSPQVVGSQVSQSFGGWGFRFVFFPLPSAHYVLEWKVDSNEELPFED